MHSGKKKCYKPSHTYRLIPQLLTSKVTLSNLVFFLLQDPLSLHKKFIAECYTRLEVIIWLWSYASNRWFFGKDSQDRKYQLMEHFIVMWCKAYLKPACLTDGNDWCMWKCGGSDSVQCYKNSCCHRCPRSCQCAFTLQVRWNICMCSSVTVEFSSTYYFESQILTTNSAVCILNKLLVVSICRSVKLLAIERLLWIAEAYILSVEELHCFPRTILPHAASFHGYPLTLTIRCEALHQEFTVLASILHILKL